MHRSRRINTYEIRRQIVDYCTSNNNKKYSEAEAVFQELLFAIDYPTLNAAMKTGTTNIDHILDNIQGIGYKINDFQKCIGTLTRYAPTPELATKYASFCLREIPEPFKDDLLEIVLTINLIYVYNKARRKEYMEYALKLIEKGVELNFHISREPIKNKKYSIARSESFSNPYLIFTSVSHPVLSYFNLKWSPDGTSIIKKF